MAATLARVAREAVIVATGGVQGQQFYKMTGSGNDFVFFDGRSGATAHLETPAMIGRICARGTGVGADGVVVIDRAPAGQAADRDAAATSGTRAADVVIRYYNADGSRASLCGNATLCAASLAVELGMADPSGFGIGTDAGVVAADVRDCVPGFELPPVRDAVTNVAGIECVGAEQRLGFATAGVPHVVIQVPELDSCDVVGRGRAVRNNRVLPVGANVNFIERTPDRTDVWRIRTYERGVEGETLACGTGSAASAILLRLWGLADGDVALETRSGKILTVSCRRDPSSGAWIPSLHGEGRLVFTGALGSL